jgi:hypothetical protein
MCFLIGPALHRIEKLDSSDAGVSTYCTNVFFFTNYLVIVFN